MSRGLVRMRTAIAAMLLLHWPFNLATAQPPQPTLAPPLRTVDLNVGESATVELADGRKVVVKLVNLRETRDEVRDAMRRAEAIVEVAGQSVAIVSANYRLPTTIAGVQIDCPVTRGYRVDATKG